jgi:hypothetical protein
MISFAAVAKPAIRSHSDLATPFYPLLFFLGDEYRVYQARVPGHPGLPAGPLARVPLAVVPVPR